MRTKPIEFRRRLSFATLTMPLLLAACDSSTAPRPELAVSNDVQLQQLGAAMPMKGIWSGVVTNAVDLNNASFGRDPSDWIGRAVTGTFTILPATPGLGDADPNPNVWVIHPIPGPGPYVEFVQVIATIDGDVFQAECGGMNPIFFGDVLRIVNQASFQPQDSCVGVRNGAIARSVVGIDAFFTAGAVTFDGTTLGIAGTPQFGFGVIDELYDVVGPERRQAAISFQVTDVTLTPLGSLTGMLLQLQGLGVLSTDQLAALNNKLDEISSKLANGNVQAACNQLVAFGNQVRGFINSGSLTTQTGDPLIAETSEVMTTLGC